MKNFKSPISPKNGVRLQVTKNHFVTNEVKKDTKNNINDNHMNNNHNFVWLKLILSKEATIDDIKKTFIAAKIKETEKSYILYVPKLNEIAINKAKKALKTQAKAIGTLRVAIYVLK